MLSNSQAVYRHCLMTYNLTQLLFYQTVISSVNAPEVHRACVLPKSRLDWE